MCFSAGASFGTGVVLSLIAATTIKRVAEPAHRPFALFPFIFAMQQFIEGFVWLSFTSSAYAAWHSASTYAFLTFSHVIWPVWIPFSMLLLEKSFGRLKIIRVLLGAGIILALYHVYCLLFLPVASRTDGHHIQYIIAHPMSLLFPANVFYALATVLPFFISSVKRSWWIGLFIAISYIGAFIIYEDHIVSVWCFFATFISVFVYLILAGIERITLKKKIV